jgi:hypothetical protein
VQKGLENENERKMMVSGNTKMDDEFYDLDKMPTA